MASTTNGLKSDRLPRGSNPPYINLPEAFNLVRGIYEQGGGRASRDLMSRLTGNSASSSSLIKKIAALKAYGLATEQEEVVYLSDQGNAIAAPISENVELAAKKSSLLNIPVFAKIYERHKGKLLPADEFLRNIVEQDFGIPRDLSPLWVSAFKESSRSAGILYVRPDGKIQIMESAQPEGGSSVTQSVDDMAPNSDDKAAFRISPSAPTASSVTASTSLSASGNSTKFQLSDGRFAEFSIPFGITAKDAKRLKAYLDGLKLIIDSAVSDFDGEGT